jgi:hypothetical protein
VALEESRRRNQDRARPGLEGDASILHHGVPDVVMRGDHGVDDFRWVLERGNGRTVEVTTDNGSFTIPAAVFDERISCVCRWSLVDGPWSMPPSVSFLDISPHPKR